MARRRQLSKLAPGVPPILFGGLQIWLNRFILSIEVAHVDNQVLDDKHVRQGRNLGDNLGIPVDLGQACQTIGSIHVH